MKVQQDPMMEKLKKAGAKEKYLKKLEITQAPYKDIFREVFFRNLSFNDREKDFLTSKMSIKITIFHPIKKTELTCFGKVNDYELN